MRPISTTQLKPPTPMLLATTVTVLLLHMAALGWWQLKSADEPLRKRPDLTVQFFTPAPLPVPEPVSQTTAPQLVASPSTQLIQVAPAKPAQADPVATTNALDTEAPVFTATAAENTPVASPSVSETAPATSAMANTEADYKAAYLDNPRPPYPLAAVRQGAEGRVLLSAEVLPDGRASRVSLEKSSGHALLDAAALNTVRSWRFTPARKGGVATTQTVNIPIDFTLQNRR
jgi:protein TonB